MSLPQERSTAEQVFYTWVARSRSGSSSFTSLPPTFCLFCLLFFGPPALSFPPGLFIWRAVLPLLFFLEDRHSSPLSATSCATKWRN